MSEIKTWRERLPHQNFTSGQALLAAGAEITELRAALDEAENRIEDMEEIQGNYHLLASEMVYEGNSVQHWRQKALAYKECAGVVYELKVLLGKDSPLSVLEAVKAMQGGES